MSAAGIITLNVATANLTHAGGVSPEVVFWFAVVYTVVGLGVIAYLIWDGGKI